MDRRPEIEAEMKTQLCLKVGCGGSQSSVSWICFGTCPGTAPSSGPHFWVHLGGLWGRVLASVCGQAFIFCLCFPALPSSYHELGICVMPRPCTSLFLSLQWLTKDWCPQITRQTEFFLLYIVSVAIASQPQESPAQLFPMRTPLRQNCGSRVLRIGGLEDLFVETFKKCEIKG